MGYIVKGDFDTSYGKLNEIYCRIESFHFNRQTGYCNFSYTYWPSKHASDVHTPVYEGDSVKKVIEMLDTQIIMYADSNTFDDILLPHSIKVFAGTEKTIEEPVFEYQDYTEEIPYISFDENGNEVTKTRTVISQKKVQAGVKQVTKNVFDSSTIQNIWEFGYTALKQKISEWIPQDSILQD